METLDEDKAVAPTLSKTQAATVKQWIADLTDKDFGIKFNANLSIAVDKKKLTGDAALYLAFRHAKKIDYKNPAPDLFKFYSDIEAKIEPGSGYHPSDLIVAAYTGIPVEDACKLMWPSVLMNADDYDLEQLRPKDFVAVLRNYLKTGEVCWEMAL